MTVRKRIFNTERQTIGIIDSVYVKFYHVRVKVRVDSIGGNI